MKSTILATGYGQHLLDQPVAQTFGPEVVHATGLGAGRAQDEGDEAVPGRPQEVRRHTGIPDFGLYTGYITCELALLGLKNAGNPPTPAAFAPNLRKVGTYDRAGLVVPTDRHQRRDIRQGRADAAAAGSSR